MADITNLGKELRKLRLDLGITLFNMAEKVGVSSGMLSSVETGRKPAPADFIDRLASKYEQVAQRRAEFESLALQTKGEVKVRLDTRPHANELALAFARKFDTLSDDDIAELMAVFKKEK
jgi:transcriptional regulator with XRE-family HTH domain